MFYMGLFLGKYLTNFRFENRIAEIFDMNILAEFYIKIGQYLVLAIFKCKFGY